jgi:hypothetical protein
VIVAPLLALRHFVIKGHGSLFSEIGLFVFFGLDARNEEVDSARAFIPAVVVPLIAPHDLADFVCCLFVVLTDSNSSANHF